MAWQALKCIPLFFSQSLGNQKVLHFCIKLELNYSLKKLCNTLEVILSYPIGPGPTIPERPN